MSFLKKLILLYFISVPIFAQNTSVTNSQITQEEQNLQKQKEKQQQENEKAAKEREDAFIKDILRDISRNVDREKLIEEYRLKFRAIEELNSQFAISEEYQEKYTDFLKQKNTGMGKMFPEKKCDIGLTVTVEELERCANVPQIKGNGSRYSIKFNFIPSDLPLNTILDLFKEADIYYNGNSFLFGNENTQSIVGEIGDVNFNEINLKSSAVKFLTKFKPSRTKTEFQQQTNILKQGINENGFLYSTFASVKVNSVYVFRSISFLSDKLANRYYFWKRDLIAALKIIGKEEDGSITFIWKKLKEKTAPYLKNK